MQIMERRGAKAAVLGDANEVIVTQGAVNVNRSFACLLAHARCEIRRQIRRL